MKLKTDIKSAFHGVVYGSAGQEVKLIAQHGHVLIVQDEKGKRFPVCECDVTEEAIEIKPDPEPMETKPFRKQQLKKKAVTINTMQTLFK
jgi:hypothetical protein